MSGSGGGAVEHTFFASCQSTSSNPLNLSATTTLLPLHTHTGTAQDGVLQQQLRSAADLQAVRAIQQLEEAARRARAAAQRHHERESTQSSSTVRCSTSEEQDAL